MRDDQGLDESGALTPTTAQLIASSRLRTALEVGQSKQRAINNINAFAATPGWPTAQCNICLKDRSAEASRRANHVRSVPKVDIGWNCCIHRPPSCGDNSRFWPCGRSPAQSGLLIVRYAAGYQRKSLTSYFGMYCGHDGQNAVLE